MNLYKNENLYHMKKDINNIKENISLFQEELENNLDKLSSCTINETKRIMELSSLIYDYASNLSHERRILAHKIEELNEFIEVDVIEE